MLSFQLMYLHLKVIWNRFKEECLHSCENNYWEVSNLILEKIEGNSDYLVNKSKFNKFLIENPFIARRKGINTFSRVSKC